MTNGRELLLPEIDRVYEIFALCAGACVGSFLNVVIARIPEDISIVTPRSRCPFCHHPIAWYDNIPVLSWLLLFASCRKCKSPISARYPTVELIGATLALADYRAFGPTLHCLIMFVFVSLLVAITYIDIDVWWIPSELTNIGLAVGIGGSIFDGALTRGAIWDRFFTSAVGAIAGYGVFALVAVIGKLAFKKEALGHGDWWLLAMIGAFLGWQSLLPVILLASLQGSFIGGLLLLVYRKKSPEKIEPEKIKPAEETGEDDWTPDPTAVQFGPFLALGALEHLFVGDWLLSQYDRLAMHLRG